MGRYYKHRCNGEPLKDGTCCCSYCEGYSDGVESMEEKVLEAVRIACPRCDAMAQGCKDTDLLVEGQYAGRHVFTGDVLATCVAWPLSRVMKSQ